jgi:23S rRNA (adenine2503-C2)-methyltransferase
MPTAAINIAATEPDPQAQPVLPSLVGMTRADMAEALTTIGITQKELKMRLAQLWHWVYQRGAQDFDQLTNVSKTVRAHLAQHFTLARPEIVAEQVSKDGTRKWLLRLPPHPSDKRAHDVEIVYIPEVGRGTLCVSSQVGCTLTCTFCHTGTQKLVRNLTTAEIVAQVMVARDRLGDWMGQEPPTGAIVPLRGDRTAKGDVGRFVSNIVFMGMGEPLYNFDNVVAAVGVMSDGDGLGIGRRRITVSTSGVVPMIRPLGEQAHSMLAISLHATRDDIRDLLVPLNRKYNIAQLLDACRNYAGLSNARRITFEYVMLRDVNDSPAHARELVALLRDIPAKVNLIPFNPWPGSKYECSSWETIEAFAEIIYDAGYSSPIRTPRGRDILAACGQLKSATEKLSARARLAMAEAETDQTHDQDAAE